MSRQTVTTRTVKLRAIAYGRSGDKGGTANVGIAARHDELFPVLVRELTEARVLEHFDDRVDRVTRYELPNLAAVNFLLHGILGKGGTSTLRLDPQGKALADALLAMEISLNDEELGLLHSIGHGGR